MRSVSVVIPVYNQLALTETCLNSLLANSRLARELAVIDNASTDDTPERLKEFKKRFEQSGWNMRIFRNQKNEGFGRAMNRGIQETSGERVALLNNDTWLAPGWDEALDRRMEELRADMVAPYFDERPFDPDKTPKRAEHFVRRNQGRAIREFVPIAMYFRRDVFQKIGAFDERFFLTFEDADLHHRMDLAGMSYYIVGDSYIWHRSSGTRGREADPGRHVTEGLRLFMEKWGYDPTQPAHSRTGRLKRRWTKIRRALGFL